MNSARFKCNVRDVFDLDEPITTSIFVHQLEVLELLASLPCTVIVSLHDLSLASANMAVECW